MLGRVAALFQRVFVFFQRVFVLVLEVADPRLVVEVRAESVVGVEAVLVFLWVV